MSQNISTSMQIPPLQWINLSRLATGGSQPQPLRDAHISYDPAKQVLIIFGGESSAGVPTQSTYILELGTLTWRVPVPPTGEQDIPPARSAGVYGLDMASNYRAGMVVYGGKGGSGNVALDDLWYYHFQNEFWAQLPFTSTDNPPGRWGAAGGTAPASSIQNVETFLWLAGGMNATQPFAFDHVWQLDITGVIAAGSVVASGNWTRVPTSATDPSQPSTSRFGLAGAVIPPIGNTDREGTLVVFGGCDPNSSGVYNASCAQDVANILTLPTSSSQTLAQWTTAADCLPGSYAATMAPNRNMAASTFSSQAFLFPGAIDTNRWNDPSGTQQGEVGILLANSGVWARVLPAPDPQSTPSRPSFKEGAAVYSHSASITGGDSPWSDTVVFGGVDTATGEYTNELWLLRAYNATIQSSSDHWSGYGNGQLQSGIQASGAGVTVQYLSQCATPTSQGSASTTTSGQPSTTSSGPSSTSSSIGSTSSTSLLDGSPVHIILSPLSVAVLPIAIVVLRSVTGPALVVPYANKLLVLGSILSFKVLCVGIVGFALAVHKAHSGVVKQTALRGRDTTSADPSKAPLLSTTHGKAALALFVALYCLIPIFAAALYLTRPLPHNTEHRPPVRPDMTEKKPSDETMPTMVGSSTMHDKGPAFRISEEDEISPAKSSSPPKRMSIDSQAVISEEGDEFPARKASSFPEGSGSAGFFETLKARRKSVGTMHSAATSTQPPPPPKFEVVNRPKRSSAPLGGMYHAAMNHPSSSTMNAAVIPRNPSDLSWMERRRSVNMYGQLDYELAQGSRPPVLPTSSPPAPSSMHEMSPTTPPVPAMTPPRIPCRTCQIWFNVYLQIVTLWALLFWIVTFAIIGQWAGLIIMALVTIAFYIALVALAWIGRPRQSILAVLVGRLRGDLEHVVAATKPPSTSTPTPATPLPSSLHHPYLNSPPWRAVQPHADDEFTSRARSMDSEPLEDDDEDDDERQARMEEEMARRDVSIFTVPKRKLVVRNS